MTLGSFVGEYQHFKGTIIGWKVMVMWPGLRVMVSFSIEALHKWYQE
jgi:hypothetical protein